MIKIICWPSWLSITNVESAKDTDEWKTTQDKRVLTTDVLIRKSTKTKTSKTITLKSTNISEKRAKGSEQTEK